MRGALLCLGFLAVSLTFTGLYAQGARQPSGSPTEERMLVTSKDGTRIAVRKSGSGPAVLLIHGLGVDAGRAWGRVAPLLNSDHTVYAMDLRAHGQSGDGQDYSLSKDGDDIAAVLRTIGSPATVVAHSYGGLAVIASLDRLDGIGRLILYEPAVLTEPMSPERVRFLLELESAMAANDLDRAKVAGMRVVGVPESIIEQLHASPGWAAELSMREVERTRSRLKEHETFRPSADELAAYRKPTIMLLGSVTTGWIQQSAKSICKRMPRCELVLLEGQSHIAHESAPELFVSKIPGIGKGRAGAGAGKK